MWRRVRCSSCGAWQTNAVRQVRRDLASAIVVCGGTSLLPGLASRLNDELLAVLPGVRQWSRASVTCIAVHGRSRAAQAVKARLIFASPTERRFSAWIGGSILASLGSFQQRWCTRAEYEEEGPRAMDRYIT